MGLPIAFGSKSTSSRPLLPPSPVDDESDDGIVLEPVLLDRGPMVAVGVSADHELSVTLSIHYYDMMRQDGGGCEMTVADCRIQVSPLAEPFSSDHRDSLHRIALPPVDGLDSEAALPASVVLSSDRRHVACLIPYPRDSNSIVVVFQLRKPRAETLPMREPPRPPSYIQATKQAPVSKLVAVNPRVVRFQPSADEPEEDLLDVTALCDVYTRDKQALLLLGCDDGSILVTGYRSPLVARALFQPEHGEEAISHLHHVHLAGLRTDGLSGQLVAVLRSGDAVIYQCHVSSIDPDNGESKQEKLNRHESQTTEDSVQEESARSDTAYLDESRRSVASYERGLKAAPTSRQDMNSHFQRTPLPTFTFMKGGSIAAVGNRLSMRVERLTLIDGDFVAARWIAPSLLALLLRPGSKQVAQVWGVFGDQLVEPLAEPLATLEMTKERLDELAHGTFLLDTLDDQEDYVASNMRKVGALGLDFDEYSGCIAVSSIVSPPRTADQAEHPFVCIWHWRANVVGLVAVPRNRGSLSATSSRFLSRLFFAWHPQKGRYLAHLLSSLGFLANARYRLRKELFSTGILSPPQELNGSSCCVVEASSLFLSSSAVAFPLVSSPLSRDFFEVEWKESAVPAAYFASYGPVHTAAVGRQRGRSIAIASSRGMCILDCSRLIPGLGKKPGSSDSGEGRGDSKKAAVSPWESSKFGRSSSPKWRFFGSETEERAFSVLAMTWWEGSDPPIKFVDDGGSDDLLLAIIQLEAGARELGGRPGRRYLACWSSNRLDVGHQLMQAAQGSLLPTSRQWGVRLPDDFYPTSLTHLSEPHESTSGDERPLRRAVAMMSGMVGTNEIGCILCQLQLVTHVEDDPESYAEKQPYSVLSNCCAVGDLKSGASAATSTLSCFLAGASFRFELREKGAEEPTQSKGDKEGPKNPKDKKLSQAAFIGTVGVIQTPGGGMDAVVVTSEGFGQPTPVCPRHRNDCIDSGPPEVSRFWLADVISGGSVGNEISCFFVWTVEMTTGDMFCWLAPFLHNRNTDLCFPSMTAFSCSSRGKDQLPLPTLVAENYSGTHDPTAREFRVMQGVVCEIGSSSTWMQQSSSANHSEFPMACIPNSGFGCVLCAGQSSRILHRSVSGEFGDHSFPPDFLENEIFCPGDFIMTPPAFVSSLFAIFIESAYERTFTGTKGTNGGSEETSSTLSYLGRHMCHRLKNSPNTDAVMMCLRMLVIRSVEMIACESARMEGDGTEMHASFLLAMSVFAEIVDSVRYCTTRLQFASFFLEVGRQIEPSCFPHLFPLPLSVQKYSQGDDSLSPLAGSDYLGNDVRSVVDLFLLCLAEGSLSTAVSALPLFTTRSGSRSNCAAILQHCLLAFRENVDSDAELLFDICHDERRLIGDIYRFGTKIENAEPEWAVDDDVKGEDQRRRDTRIPIEQGSLRGTEPGLGYFVPWFFRKEKSEQEEEKKIAEAASNFILLGFEENVFDPQHNSNRVRTAAALTEESINSGSDFCDSVADVVTRTILELAVLSKPTTACSKWKRILCLADILLGENTSLRNQANSSDISSLVEEIGPNNLIPFLPMDEGGNSLKLLRQFFVETIRGCERDIGKDEASLVMDLTALLLHGRHTSRYLSPESSGLVITGVVAAHVSGRIDEVFESDSRPCHVKKSYLSASKILEKRKVDL